MVDMDVSDIESRMKREKVLSIHNYSITQPKDSASRWQTYVRDDHGKRIKVSSTTEEGLYAKLYYHYYEEIEITIKKLYPEWIRKRNELGLSARTIKRNIEHWLKYYANNAIINIPLENLDSEKIESFFHKCIVKYELTTKELGNMKFIMQDILRLAKKRNLISYNPMLDVDVRTNGCRPQTKHNDTSRVYLPEEKEKLFAELNKELNNKPECTDAYAVFILFKLGLRIGELVALKWRDLDYQNCELHIHRIETLANDVNGNLRTTIEEHTKKRSPYGDRFLPLGDYEIGIFRKIAEINITYGYHDNDFIFCDTQGRTNIRAIDNLIRKCCSHAGIEIKSAHDIRRTVASEMFNNGVPVEIIRNYLGHSDVKTTFGYILDNHRKSETNRMIIESLRSMNGLMGTQNP